MINTQSINLLVFATASLVFSSTASAQGSSCGRGEMSTQAFDRATGTTLSYCAPPSGGSCAEGRQTAALTNTQGQFITNPVGKTRLRCVPAGQPRPTGDAIEHASPVVPTKRPLHCPSPEVLHRDPANRYEPYCGPGTDGLRTHCASGREARRVDAAHGHPRVYCAEIPLSRRPLAIRHYPSDPPPVMAGGLGHSQHRCWGDEMSTSLTIQGERVHYCKIGSSGRCGQAVEGSRVALRREYSPLQHRGQVVTNAAGRQILACQ